MNIPDEILEEMKSHVKHFCSLGWNEELRTLTFGCAQCQVSLLEIADEDETTE